MSKELFKDIVECLYAIQDFKRIDREQITKIEFRADRRIIIIDSFIVIELNTDVLQTAFSICFNSLKEKIPENAVVLINEKGIMIDSSNRIYLILT